jgi:hypothetical protein
VADQSHLLLNFSLSGCLSSRRNWELKCSGVEVKCSGVEVKCSGVEVKCSGVEARYGLSRNTPPDCFGPLGGGRCARRGSSLPGLPGPDQAVTATREGSAVFEVYEAWWHIGTFGAVGFVGVAAGPVVRIIGLRSVAVGRVVKERGGWRGRGLGGRWWRV